MNKMKYLVLSLFLLLGTAVVASAQESATSEEQAGGGEAAQANNPLADIQAFNLQNYYIPELSGDIDSTANNFVLRYAQPFADYPPRQGAASFSLELVLVKLGPPGG